MAAYATFIENNDDFYVCDKCKKIFKAKDVKLVDAKTGFNSINFMMPFIFIGKDGNITGGSKSAQEGDKVLSCPHCDYVHLFGFEKAKNSQSK